MTSVADLVGNLAGRLTGATSAASPRRSGALVMPPQATQQESEFAANESYDLEFSPGFEEGPVWPVETWLLSSFQVSLSGTLSVPLELELTPEIETLPVVLALVQNGHPVWSQNVALRLVPVLGSDKRQFKFATGVFVDLVTPLRYDAGAQPHFVVSGIVPVYKPPEPTFEEEALARLATIVAALQSQGATLVAANTLLGEAVSELEAAGVTQTEIVQAVEATGVSEDEAVELLQQIATNTEGATP